MLSRKITKLSCPNCKRTGPFPIGPAKEQAQCDHCGTLFQVPHVNIRRRRWLKAIGIGMIGNLLTPNWRVWDLFRPRVRPLQVAVNDKINLGDNVDIRPQPAASLIFTFGEPTFLKDNHPTQGNHDA
jgi:hypothetical protein